jgi:hypothetical protein
METTKDVQQIATADQIEIKGGDTTDLAVGAVIGVALVGGAVASGPLLVAAAGGWCLFESFSYMFGN